MRLFCAGIILSVFIHLPAYPAGEEPAMESVINNYASFISIKASIVQHIFNPDKTYVKMSGDYSATGAGLMRIDYYYPSRQTVVNNPEGLFWYYPESEVLYSAKSGDMNSESLPVFLKRVYREGEDLFRLYYRGWRFYGLFNRAHIFDIRLKDGNTFRIWADYKESFVLRRYLLDSSGREIVKEIYSDYREIDGIFIPAVIEVRARTASGTVRTLTEYSNIVINSSIDPSIFDFKIRKYMKVRSFNDN